MKKNKLFAFMFVGALLAAGCNSKLPQKVDYPHYAFRNANSQELVSVERTDTATILSFKSFFRPNWWILVAPEAYLTDGKARYALKGTEGITPGEHLHMDDNGNAEYKLFFEPIPNKTKDISYIEAEGVEGAFNFYHIDLSGKAGTPLKVPASHSDALPEIELKAGTSQLEVHLPCSLKGLQPVNVSLYVNDFFPPEQNEYSTVMDENGVATFSFEHHGPARAILVVGHDFSYGYILIHPGETVTVTVDGSGRNLTAERLSLPENPSPYAVYSGHFAAINNLGREGDKYSFNALNGEFASDAKNMSEYANTVYAIYKEKRASLDADDSISPAQREYLQAFIASEAISALSNASYIRRVQYEAAHQGDRTGYVAESFSPEDLSFLKELDLNNPRMALMGPAGILAPALSPLVFPERKCPQADYIDAYPISQKVLKGATPDDDEMAVLEALGTPFYKDCILSQVEANKAASEAMPACVKEIPDVPADKLLDTILSQYKGKVLLVDFWATWCGPCRAGHKAMEPLKDSRFKDVTFVYFTSTTSPLPKWKEMIGDIRGDHYYFSDEQLTTIFTQIESNAYPTYLIVGRDGKIQDKVIGYSEDVLAELDKALRME